MKIRCMRATGALLALALTLTACQSAPAPKTIVTGLPTVQGALRLNDSNRERGYQVYANGDKVAFIFDASLYGIEGAARVSLEASFNGWPKGTDPAWDLAPKTGGKTWTLSVDSAKVRVPGNSGYPEFIFFVEIADLSVPTETAAISANPGYRMAGHNLLLFPGDNPADVEASLAIADTVKQLSDFNLSDAEQLATLSNVRLVPGTQALWRGYHPYKTSRPQFETEGLRGELAKESLETNGIQCVITLSGDEKPSGGESISAYHQAIIAAGRQLNASTSYNTVYFRSAEASFGSLIRLIVRFIVENPGPYYIHCRLGTDRTGVVSAVLAALCGASWEDIVADFEKSNLMGIKEYRDHRILQYSFERMLGKPMSEVTDLRAEMSARFIDGGYLTEDDIDALRQNLGAE